MDNRDRWRERVREVCADDATWWWWCMEKKFLTITPMNYSIRVLAGIKKPGSLANRMLVWVGGGANFLFFLMDTLLIKCHLGQSSVVKMIHWVKPRWVVSGSLGWAEKFIQGDKKKKKKKQNPYIFDWNS